MRNQRNTLLAGLAALALVAGTGLASAQQDQGGAAPTKEPHATQQMNKAPAAGKMGQSAQSQNRNANVQKSNRQATQMNRGDKTANTNIRSHRAAQATQSKNRTMASGDANKGRQTSAQHDRMQGLQANASGMNVRLNDEQRTQIRTTMIEAHGAPRVDHVNFDVTVGTVVPRSGIRIVPVPASLARIQPAWRGFRYFVYEQEVIIVNPHGMKIVAVVTV
jgi:Protein of unknown function (DUF1236)